MKTSKPGSNGSSRLALIGQAALRLNKELLPRPFHDQAAHSRMKLAVARAPDDLNVLSNYAEILLAVMVGEADPTRLGTVGISLLRSISIRATGRALSATDRRVPQPDMSSLPLLESMTFKTPNIQMNHALAVRFV